MQHEIGVMAGQIWKALEANGEMTVAALKKALGTRDVTADWAIGWLAREGKIVLRKERNTVRVALYSD